MALASPLSGICGPDERLWYNVVGNSGVIYFGQISLVAVAAFSAGVTTIPIGPKQVVLPDSGASPSSRSART
ncbi:MAG: hypothetical protein NVSMB25_05810 [Thermoleophilaceae bacterium]